MGDVVGGSQIIRMTNDDGLYEWFQSLEFSYLNFTFGELREESSHFGIRTTYNASNCSQIVDSPIGEYAAIISLFGLKVDWRKLVDSGLVEIVPTPQRMIDFKHQLVVLRLTRHGHEVRKQLELLQRV